MHLFIVSLASVIAVKLQCSHTKTVEINLGEMDGSGGPPPPTPIIFCRIYAEYCAIPD